MNNLPDYIRIATSVYDTIPIEKVQSVVFKDQQSHDNVCE